MSKFVLLVVDMLNDFFDQHTELAAQRQSLITATNALIAEFRLKELPVIWTRQEFQADLSDSFLVMRKLRIPVTIAGTPGCEILSELDKRKTDRVILKKRYSAFFGTDLERFLVKTNAEAIVVCGVNTHACVRMSAIDAYQRDYEVILAEDCVASYDSVHHEVTMKYLGQGIARVLGNNEIRAILAAH